MSLRNYISAAHKDKEKRKEYDKMGLDRGLSDFTLMSKYSRVQHESPKRVRADILTKINSYLMNIEFVR